MLDKCITLSSELLIKNRHLLVKKDKLLISVFFTFETNNLFCIYTVYTFI